MGLKMNGLVKATLLFIFSITTTSTYSNNTTTTKTPDAPIASLSKVLETELLYTQTGLSQLIDYKVLFNAMNGFNKINPKKKILAIIDFNKPSNEERLFVIDVQKKQLLYQSLVAHGKNSGEKFASQFSNKNGSLQSSLGFYLAGEVINSPKHGYAMILNGLEAGINDNARERQIIVHSANYVSQQFIKTHGMLGRSWGCPALPPELNKKIIDTIKDGAVIFIAGNDPHYNDYSKYLRS
ncbi:murein L,D-transpeptidase catalytic domain family protein [Solitalea koreensis]|uniref:L,D-transpeptidase catalytic domain n=1 Tax=Solitalea koreensis TaxID=543615 RepID=A0A521CME6_9SPHI|nr:murein L,D-transpeptidase catalytic domain family protein [Solitalea koreensis]SMO60617.1 L,D-transpeptidase catalytic domain [Solitalea koreensis]